MSVGGGADPRVAIELGRAMRRQAPLGAFAATSLGCFIAWLAWPHVPHAHVVGWLATLFLLKAVQFGGPWERFFGADTTGAGWERSYLGFMVATGLIWSVSPFLFLTQGDSPSNALILAAFLALGSGTVPVLMYHFAGLAAFLVILFVPLACRLVTLERDSQAVLALFTMVFMMGFGRIQARVTRESVRLRFENDDLVEQLREKQEAVEAALLLAQNANRQKSQFFAAANHDLRQPLHALALFSASLRELNPEPERRAVVDQVYASIESLETLFDEVLDLSKLDAGYVAPNRTHFPVSRLFDALGRQFSPLAAEAGVSLRIVPSRAIVHTDATLLSRIVSNLVSNAIRYTPAGRVTVGCRRHRGALRLEVHDTGVGIPAAEHERIFDEFVRLAPVGHERRQRGLGLGLTSVRRLSALLGHPLALASTVGHGTSFRLSVPLGDSDCVLKPAARPREVLDILFNKRIIVIDDEPAIRQGMNDLLCRWGCQVLTAGDEAEAVDLLSVAGPPDLIVSDHRLAGSSLGTDVIDALRTRFGAGIPALLITADSSPELLAHARLKGHLLQQKPVRPIQLRAACNQLLAAGRISSRDAGMTPASLQTEP